MVQSFQGRVLIIAGSDSGGGAGIQADIKAVTCLGGFAMTAVTAITAQNTLGVSAIHGVPLEMVRAQIKAVMDDLGADIIKIGMLGTADMVMAVRAALDAFAPHTPLVLDPVMIAKGGHPLLEEDAVNSVAAALIPRAALITPNAPEAARLTGIGVDSHAGQIAAGEKLLQIGAKAALVKGGHIEGDIIRDVLCTSEGHVTFESPTIETRSTHGTGCTLASAIAALLAQGATLQTAILQARDYLREAILTAPGFGAGHGPLNHGWTVKRPAKPR